MKKFLLIIGLLVSVPSLYNVAHAQNISVNINIGKQPAWGPVGYDYVGYYYFPDIDCYYDVNLGMFHYMDRGRWVSSRYLPYAYRSYDLYGLYKVVLNVNEPWRYHRNHYRDYARYRGYRNQIIIRDSRDHRYYSSRNNRVSWYSDRRDDRYNRNSYNSGRWNNNKRTERDYNRNDSRTNSRQEYRYDKNNTRPNVNSNSNRNSSVNNRTKERVSRPTTSNERSNFRMASNTGRNVRN